MIIKIQSDKERAKSIVKLLKEREDLLKILDVEKFSATVLENYYEIAKELIISLMYIDGFKTTGEGAHKEIINYLSSYKEFSQQDIYLLDEMRVKRNKSSYYGIAPNPDFIKQNEKSIKEIIQKLKKIIAAKAP